MTHIDLIANNLYSKQMITITVDNSYSQITGLQPDAFNALRKALSYGPDPQAAYYTGGFPKLKYLMDKRGNFPTGLLYRVKAFVGRQNVQIKDRRAQPTAQPPGMLKMIYSPYKDQTQAVDMAENFHTGIISMPTGSGKSLVIALIAARLNLRTLVIVPNLEIKTQLYVSFRVLGIDTNKVHIENIDSRSLTARTDYDCLIIDEAHHSAASTYQKLNKMAWKGIYYRFFLTATPFRNNNEEMLLFEGIAGKLIYELSYEKAVAKNYIVPVEAYYIEIPKQKTNAYSWQEVYKELVINHHPRNTLVASLLTSLQSAGMATLCLVKEIAHGQLLSALTGIPFANGQDEDSRQYIRHFNSGEIKSLIGTTGILGEGVDTKPCEYVVIAGLGKAKSAFMQQVGRAVRTYQNKESAKIVIIKDKSHKFLLRHFNSQCKILLEEYKTKPIKLEL